jgi:hypothetical protein
MSDTEYIFEIQSDIHIQEHSFDQKMIVALNNLNLGTLSGRLLHPFALLDNFRSFLKYPFWKFRQCIEPEFQCVGLMGRRVFSNSPVNVLDTESVYIGETNARGPWLVRRSDLVSLDYLDEKNFFLGNDDHDFNRRIFQRFGKRAGYMPVKQFSFISDGSSRKVRTGINKEIYDYLQKEKMGSVSFNEFLKNYTPYLKTEIIPFSLINDLNYNDRTIDFC